MNDPLARYRSYIESQFCGAPSHEAEAMPFITISRQAGAGGLTIARLAADRLRERDIRCGYMSGWSIFDKSLVDEVLRDHGLSKDLAGFLSEDSSSDIEDILQELFGIHPAKGSLVHQTSETILRLARLGRVILVGRGANIVTRRLEGGLHVRLVGSLEKRLKHLKEYFGFDTVEAAEFLHREDEGRRRYVKKYFGKDIDDPLLYDLVLNTDNLSHEEAAALIAHAARHTASLTACLSG